MSSSTPQNRDQSSGQGRQGQGQNRNRRRSNNHRNDRNRENHTGNRGGGGGARSGGVHFSKMPRRKPKPSLWQRLLGLVGLGNKAGAKPKAKSAQPRDQKPKVRSTVTKSASERKPREPRVKRAPERVEVTSSRLYVGNLSYDASESDLMELFNGVGTVSNVEVVYNTRTQRSKGYAFLDMQNVDEAKRAVDELHDKEYMGRKMVVSGAKSPKESDVA